MTSSSLRFLLDGSRQREQPLFDFAWHVAGIAQRPAAILKDLGVPHDLLRHLIEFARVGRGIRLQRVKFRVIVTQARGEFPLAGAEPVQSRDDRATLVVEHAEQPGEQFQQLRLFVLCASREIMNFVLCLFDRETSLRGLPHEVGHRRIGLRLLRRRTRPDRGQRQARHFYLLARPVGIRGAGRRRNGRSNRGACDKQRHDGSG